MEGMKVLDTTGYGILYTRSRLVIAIAIVVATLTLGFMIFALKDAIIDSIIGAILVGLLSLFVAIFVITMCATICNFIVEPGAPTYQMEVYVEDGYKFDAGFLEEWGIKEQITENVYILERRRYSDR